MQAKTQRIDVGDLRVGMFIQLDLGWMAHPFPLSSFRIQAPGQIEEIRALGVTHVQWVPERSDPAVRAASAATTTPASRAPEPTETPEQAEARARRELLQRQRHIARVCERQYHEASKAWRAAFERVGAEPVRARQEAEGLSRALLSKMLGDGETCIRVLNSASGDRSTAHAINVAVMSLLLGRAVGLDDTQMMDVGVGALMHDVGKLNISEHLRHIDDHFTPSEVMAYRDHVRHGVEHARRMGLSAGAAAVVQQHHEHADGTGFPGGLRHEAMSEPARIVALVNRFDTLCNPALLARAMTPHEALSHLFSQARSRHDATLLAAFIRMMGVYPAGSVVQLTDDRYAIVVSVNASRPLKPQVLVYDPVVPEDQAAQLDLSECSSIGIRRSLRPTQLPTPAKAYLAPRPRVAYFFETTVFGTTPSVFDVLAPAQGAVA